jgi:hypothetical protein
MSLEVCSIAKQKIGRTRCVAILQNPAYIIETPNGFELTAANLATEADLLDALQTAIKAGEDVRIVNWPRASRSEDSSERAVRQEAALGTQKVREGNYRRTFFFNVGLCTAKAMYTRSRKDGRLIIIDQELNGLLIQKSNGNFAGMTIDLLDVEKPIIGTGEAPSELPVYVSLANAKEMMNSGFIYDFSCVPELEPLTEVEVAVAVVSATVLTVTITNKCDGTKVTGLAQADFSVLTTAGAAQGLTAFAANANGTYTLTKGTNFVDGTVDLVAPSVLTLDAYETSGATAFDIP